MQEFPSITITNDLRVRDMLSIPADQIVQSLYDVLNVAPECSLDQIQVATIDRIDRVRRYQVGAYEATALSVLELLSQTYVLLTSDPDRSRYDEWLKQRNAKTPVFKEIPQEVPQELPTQIAPSVPVNGVPVNSSCPKCGKQSPPRAVSCYHCGHRRTPKSTTTVESSLAGNVEISPIPRMAALWGADQQSWFDLTPEQIQVKLSTQRKLRQASLLAATCWQKPIEAQGNSRQRSTGEPSARSLCYRCGRALLVAEDAFGLRHSQLTSCVEYLTMFARRFESLGRHKFQWPLQEDELRVVREMLPSVNQNRIILGCKACTERFLSSPRIAAHQSTE